jgi:hypothetical protein
MNNKAQIAIEFLLVLAIALAVTMILLVSFLSISKDTTAVKSYYDLEDLGQALQQEFFLATELEDGYTRKINLPLTLGDRSSSEYHVSILYSNNSNLNRTYLILSYDTQETYYAIPYVSGIIIRGNNVLVKSNGTLKIN